MTPYWRAVLRNDRLKIHERLTFSELGIFASFTRKMLTNLKICFLISGDDHPIHRSEVLSSIYLCRVLIFSNSDFSKVLKGSKVHFHFNGYGENSKI